MELFTYIKETLRIDEKIPRRIRKYNNLLQQ